MPKRKPVSVKAWAVVWTPPPPDTNHCKPSMLPSAVAYLVIVLAVVAGIWIVALK